MEALFFWLFAAVAVIPAILILTTRDIVHCALWLLASLAGVAGLYVLLGADFLGFVQVLIYMGGILVLILFGIMLINKDPVLMRHSHPLRLPTLGLMTGVAVLLAVLYAFFRTTWNVDEALSARNPIAGLGPQDAALPTTDGLGVALLSRYVLPFELASILLLVALVGAAYVARLRGQEQEEAAS